jgi:hypothetical protein
MSSTVRSPTQLVEQESSQPASMRWRSWPLADNLRWSWTIPAAFLCIGAMVYWLGGGWLLALPAMAGLALALWQFFVPVEYEICPHGVRRETLGRTRLVPWQTVGAYQLRTSALVFFQRPHPDAIDIFSSFFVPYPANEDEVVCAVRFYLPNVTELSR